jgi:hypothetical protein
MNILDIRRWSHYNSPAMAKSSELILFGGSKYA